MATTTPRQVTGVRPKINEAREFLEIAKDFKHPQEILREALSNSWDANATQVSIDLQAMKIQRQGQGRRKERLNVTIIDDGDGMSEQELPYFFNLGDSHKPAGSIGTKGHGTKIYYKGSGVKVTTHRNGERIEATMKAPWESLQGGVVPQYDYILYSDGAPGRGTKIHVEEFDAKPSEFEDMNMVLGYLKWNTVCGSLSKLFGRNPRNVSVTLRLPGAPSPILTSTEFDMPTTQEDLSKGTQDILKHFPPRQGIDAGATSSSQKVTVDFHATLLGVNARSFIPDYYNQSGIWFCKDDIIIERRNDIITDVTGGEYNYGSFLAFVNCQQFDLTANRNEIREDEAFELAYDTAKAAFKTIWEDAYTKQFLTLKSKEDETNKRSKAQKEMEVRFENYKKRPALAPASPIPGLPTKEPVNEAETVLVLQALISAGNKTIDFRLGEYSANAGTDAIIEFEDKGLPRPGWMEAVKSLDNLFKWDHDLNRIHKIVCWDLGNIKPKYQLSDGSTATYEKVGKKHVIHYEGEAIPVYVLSEIIGQ
ncbi:MAG: ATP-binding protein [Nitrososphaerota archaeon]|nr:ATP-binding protein [Nitrososphaerota archaeon]